MNPRNMMSDDILEELSNMERESPDGYTESYLEVAIEGAGYDIWELEDDLHYLRDQQRMLKYTDPRALDLIAELTDRENAAKCNLNLFEELGYESEEVAH